MATRDLSQAHWRKSSQSGDTGNCVEIALASNLTGVRDSKNRDGEYLVLNNAGWVSLRSAIKKDQLSNA